MPVRPSGAAPLAAALAVLFAAPVCATQQGSGSANSTVYDPNRERTDRPLGDNRARTVADEVVNPRSNPPRVGLEFLRTPPDPATTGTGAGDVKITSEFFGGPAAVDGMFDGAVLNHGRLARLIPS